MAKNHKGKEYLDSILSTARSMYRERLQNKKQYVEIMDQNKDLQAKLDDLNTKYGQLMGMYNNLLVAIQKQVREGDKNGLESLFNNSGQSPVVQSPTGPSMQQYGNGLDSGDQRVSGFDKALNLQEGSGFGNIYSNRIKAQMLREAEEKETSIVGREAALDEKQKIVIKQEQALFPPTSIGIDNRGLYTPPKNADNYLPLLRNDIKETLYNGKLVYYGSATYGFRAREWFFRGWGADLDKGTLMNKIMGKARALRFPYNNTFSRGIFNPSIEGEDFSFTLYGPARPNIVAGLFQGYRGVLNLKKPVSANRYAQILLTLEPQSGSERYTAEQNA